ncbi:hypothetical protein [Chiayiivirga flava]|uniref:Uncharacterized protein n=1 Tax=Chiayiivirga flava TaxID=659595 RepID=A0A7W8D7Q2_9GAMM|nr:hypothetical protein [Chiayiivirga flava]MBB5208262.1 hypothetical protein [Chiayiivirga flava]
MSGFLRLLCIAALALTFPAQAAPVGTAFTYQGELRLANAPADGTFDFEFALFDAPDAIAPLATSAAPDTPVQGGLFTVALDYTDVPFVQAQAYFLEVRVRSGSDSGGFQALLPRQPITPVPYAISARSVQPGGVEAAAIAPRAVGQAQLADGSVTLDKLAFVPGDIQAVVAGDGLLGGGGSGVVALTIDPAYTQRRIGNACAPGSYITSVDVQGVATCGAPNAQSRVAGTQFIEENSLIAIPSQQFVQLAQVALPAIASGAIAVTGHVRLEHSGTARELVRLTIFSGGCPPTSTSRIGEALHTLPTRAAGAADSHLVSMTGFRTGNYSGGGVVALCAYRNGVAGAVSASTRGLVVHW